MKIVRLRVVQVPQVGVKEERRVLKVRERRLNAEMGCLGKPQPKIGSGNAYRLSSGF